MLTGSGFSPRASAAWASRNDTSLTCNENVDTGSFAVEISDISGIVGDLSAGRIRGLSTFAESKICPTTAGGGGESEGTGCASDFSSATNFSNTTPFAGSAIGDAEAEISTFFFAKPSDLSLATWKGDSVIAPSIPPTAVSLFFPAATAPP